jgi:hypothetical protein
MEDLAKRAVACPGWRWMPGMLIQTVGGPTDRIAGIDSTFIHAWAESQQTENPRGMWIRYRLDRMNKHGVPDLSDAATVGALLALVREAWGDPWIRVEPMSREWRTLHSRPAPFSAGPTEAAALVAALEAAP